MQIRSIREIASEIRTDWGCRISSEAESYLKAMERLTKISDLYINETAGEIVARFLGVANTWRGPTARKVKKELQSMLDLQCHKHGTK